MISKRSELDSDLNIFLVIVIILLIIGFLFIYSASAIYALEMFGDSHYFVKKQCVGLAVGLVALVIARFIPVYTIKKMVPLFLMGSLGLVALTLLPSYGIHIHGSSRWIKLMGIAFQPSELLKIAFILYLGLFFSHKYSSFTIIRYAPLIGVSAVISFLLLKQPDFGLTMTLLCTAILLFFIVQQKIRYVIGIILALLGASIALIITQPYRLQRVLTFLNPWDDPQGKGFQIIQSFIAIGSGGWLGTGIAHSKQKFFYLPMQHTDFIFSIIAEETGFIGSLFVITLFIFFVYFGIRIAKNIKDPFCSFCVLGFTLLLGLQSIINIAVTTGLVPTKGIGLPFISYGNSSLVCTLIIIGLIINMVHQDQWTL